jgi:hypothetical protein
VREAERDQIWRAFLLLDDRIPDESWDDPKVEDTMDGFRRLICVTYGHMPVADQCGLPQHDFCMICQELMPGQAQGRETAQ